MQLHFPKFLSENRQVDWKHCGNDWNSISDLRKLVPSVMTIKKTNSQLFGARDRWEPEKRAGLSPSFAEIVTALHRYHPIAAHNYPKHRQLIAQV
jgi:hypothetical protein